VSGFINILSSQRRGASRKVRIDLPPLGTQMLMLNPKTQTQRHEKTLRHNSCDDTPTAATLADNDR
jgi:hypothetical protein